MNRKVLVQLGLAVFIEEQDDVDVVLAYQISDVLDDFFGSLSD